MSVVNVLMVPADNRAPVSYEVTVPEFTPVEVAVAIIRRGMTDPEYGSRHPDFSSWVSRMVSFLAFEDRGTIAFRNATGTYFATVAR
jgi:hypothetical protein